MRNVGKQGVECTMRNTAFLAIGLLAVQAASGAKLTCYQDPRTDAMQCIDEKRVKEREGIRITSLYTGGPNKVEATSFSIHVNCRTNVFHLKDRNGVSFAGGSGSETKASRALRDMVCEAKPSK